MRVHQRTARAYLAVVRKRQVVVLVVACAVTAALTAFIAGREERPPDGPPVVTEVVSSRVLSEERELMVNLPEGYQREPARRYPVLYVLDGSSHTSPTAESARLLARIGVMPEVIVVGLPSSSENRARDYTPPYMRADGEAGGPAGGGDRFLRFIEAEVIPHVDRRYRTTATRMLAGNSRGGLFVVYSLVERPELFCARFAYSPALWRDDDRIIAELARSLRVRGGAPGFVYLSLGDRENAKMTRAFRKAVEVLRTSASPAVRWRADVTRGADHGNNASLSTPVALREYFKVSTTFQGRPPYQRP